MDIITLAQVKERRVRSGSSTTDTDIIQTVISDVSRRIEGFIDRGIHIESRTEYFDVAERQTVFPLYAYPDVTITSVRNDIQWTFSSSAEVSSAWYRVDQKTGLLHVWDGVLSSGAQALKVTYTGGMAVAVDDLATEYEDLCGACLKQVLFEYRQRHHVGASNVSGGAAGSVSYVEDSGFLAAVERVLERYQRV